MIKSLIRTCIMAMLLFCFLFQVKAQDCPPVSVPYSENFDELYAGYGVLPECWTNLYETDELRVNNGGNPEKCLQFGGDCCAILPQMSVPLNTLRINFDMSSRSTSNEMYVVAFDSPDDYDLATIVYLDTITMSTTYTYQSFEVHLNHYTGMGRYIGFYFSGSGSDYSYVDNIVVSELPNCLNPINIQASSITSNSALITWDEVGTATQWRGILSTNPITNFSGQTPISLSSPSYMPANLTPNTTYYFYVQSVCGAENSEWSSCTFTTLCGCSNLPLTEGFSSMSLPACWNVQSLSGNATLTFVSTGNNPIVYSPGSCMVQWASGTYPAGRQARLVSPAISTQGTSALSVAFDWYHGVESPEAVNEGVQIQYSTDGVTWTNAAQNMIPRCQEGMSGWTPYEVVIPAAGNQPNVYVGFLFSSDAGRNCYLDNVSLTAASGCFVPANVTVSDIAGNSAVVSWSEVGSATSWQLVRSEQPVTNFSGMNIIPVNTSSYTFTDLNPLTTYYLYVRSSCSDNTTSAWSQGVSFTTGCGLIMHLPYSENFENNGVGGNAFPDCWSRPATSYYNTQQTPSITDIAANEGERSLIFCTGSNSQTYAISPAINEDIHQLGVSFFLYRENEQYSGTLEVGVMSDPNDYATFESVRTFNPTAETWTFCSASFANTNTTGAGKHIAFRHNGVVDFNYCLMDEVVILEDPDCWPATHLEVSDVTGNSASFSWLDVNETPASWHLKISEDYMQNPDGYANVIDTIISGNTFSINYLNGGTTYYFYLQPDCGSNQLGVWQNLTFNTDPCNCFVRINMEDQYGDGWNGAMIRMKRGNTVIAEVTLEDGTSGSEIVYTCESGNIDYYFVSGAHDEEVSFNIVNNQGVTIYTSNGIPGSSFFSNSPSCGVSCTTAPNNVTATNVQGGATITWSPVANAQTYAIYRNGALIAEYIPSTSYTDYSMVSGDNCYTVAATCIVGQSAQSGSSCVVGIDDSHPLCQIGVYPNPTSGVFTVQLEMIDLQQVEIQVFDVFGKQLFTKNVTGNLTEINLSSMSSGIYVLRMVAEGNVVATAKVVKQ
ncbi:MAG: choice-of-anchor J domain-containing protein [Bacteroidales bacterium]|nr:choice-of-anchor J domain-containing protein [Bacteroidales bacterium]